MSHEAEAQYIYWIRYNEDEKVELQAWKDELERSIEPCDKTIEQFKCFLIEELGMQPVPMQDSEVNRHKAIFIENHHKDWIQTPEIKLPKDRTPTEVELKEKIARSKQRFAEALAIPLEETGLIFSKYEAEYVQDFERPVKLTVVLEESHYIYEVHGGGRGRRTPEEKSKLDDIVQSILLYKGVSAEDIRTKSQNFKEYVATIISFQLRNGVKHTET